MKFPTLLQPSSIRAHAVRPSVRLWTFLALAILPVLAGCSSPAEEEPESGRAASTKDGTEAPGAEQPKTVEDLLGRWKKSDWTVKSFQKPSSVKLNPITTLAFSDGAFFAEEGAPPRRFSGTSSLKAPAVLRLVPSNLGLSMYDTTIDYESMPYFGDWAITLKGNVLTLKKLTEEMPSTAPKPYEGDFTIVLELAPPK